MERGRCPAIAEGPDRRGAPQAPGRPCSVRSRPTQQQEPAGDSAGLRTRPSETDPANRARLQWRDILAEAFAVLPAILVGASIIVYLAWWGGEMGSRVARGHGLLLGILGCVVVSIVAVVLGLRAGKPKRGHRNAGHDSD
jgi:hypothetical protein